MHAAARRAIERRGVRRARPARPSSRASASASSMRRSLARTDAQPPHAPGAQRLEHGIDAVDDHAGSTFESAAIRGCSDRPSAALNRLRRTPRARSRAADDRRDARRPAAAAAPRSIAGTARSSSGPPPSPVSATRIGWKSALPFCPVRSLHARWPARGTPRDRAAARRSRVRGSAAITVARARLVQHLGDLRRAPAPPPDRTRTGTSADRESPRADRPSRPPSAAASSRYSIASSVRRRTKPRARK